MSDNHRNEMARLGHKYHKYDSIDYYDDSDMILGFLGVIMVIIIIKAGFQWMTSGGSSETIEKAKKEIVNAVIGIVIVFLSLSISWFVIESLTEVVG